MLFLFLLVLALALAVAILGLVGMAIFRRRVSRTAAVTLVSLFVVTAVLCWDEAHKPFLDDGPFHGRACSTIPSSPPDQQVQLARHGFVIQTWDRGPGRPAPIVLLRDRSGATKWCIYAEAYPETEVERLRFGTSGGLFMGATVDASVRWTYGDERSLWFISNTGSLQEYWYSW